MRDIIAAHQEQIDELCRSYHVQRLAVFGSVLREDFDEARSDIDLVVEFQPLSSGKHYTTYFGLLEGLSRLFGRKVDLVMRSAIRNPYFLLQLERTNQVLYAA